MKFFDAAPARPLWRWGMDGGGAGRARAADCF